MRLDRSPGPLRLSLLLLTSVILLAEAGLALDRNWPKLIRVGLAAAAYITPLAIWSRSGRLQTSCPWWRFALAGALAGAVSGIARPSPVFGVVVTQLLAASLLFGTAHWLAVRLGPVILKRITT
jgi:hypothetical protein